MYFENRSEAGVKLAERLKNYRYDNCIVVALSDGAVLLGEQIAISLHSALTILLTEQVEVPGEQSSFGTVDQTGAFVYNHNMSSGEFDEYYSEFHSYLDNQKREKFQRINRLIGNGGILDREMLREQVVILVADGLPDGSMLIAATEFLKSIKIKKLVIATAVASVSAVDSMHMLADELHVLNPTHNFLDVNHYFEDNNIPSHEKLVELINQIVLKWK